MVREDFAQNIEKARRNPPIIVSEPDKRLLDVFWKTSMLGSLVKYRKDMSGSRNIAVCMVKNCIRNPDTPGGFCPSHIESTELESPPDGMKASEVDSLGETVRYKWCKNGKFKTKRRICSTINCSHKISRPQDTLCITHGGGERCQFEGCDSNTVA